MEPKVAKFDRLFEWLHRESMCMLTQALVSLMLILVHAWKAEAKRRRCRDS